MIIGADHLKILLIMGETFQDLTNLCQITSMTLMIIGILFKTLILGAYQLKGIVRPITPKVINQGYTFWKFIYWGSSYHGHIKAWWDPSSFSSKSFRRPTNKRDTLQCNQSGSDRCKDWSKETTSKNGSFGAYHSKGRLFKGESLKG